MVLTLDGKLWYLLDKELDVGNRNNSHGTLSIITNKLLAKKLMPKNEKEDYSYEKDQEISCYTVSSNMVMAMGVTAFAADSLADGKYTAKQNLYKNSACTTTSMGGAALNDMRAEITIADDEATLVVHTHEITYLGLTGHLGKMVVNGKTVTPKQTTTNGVTDYYFTFTGLDASTIYEGCVITGKFTTYVGSMPMNATGYLKLTDITAK